MPLISLHRKEIVVASLITLLGAVMFSTKAVIVKLAYREEIDYLSLLLLRMVFSFPFYVAIFFHYNQNTTYDKLNNRTLIWIGIMGVLGYYLASIFDFMGLQYISAGLERVILFIYPTLVLIISWLLFRKRISKIQIVAILLTYFGVAIAFLLGDQSIQSDNYIIGGGLIFLAAIVYAAYLVGSGWLLPRIGTFRFTSLAMIFTTFFLVIHFVVAGRSFAELTSYNSSIYIYSILMAIIATVLPSFLISEGIKRIGVNNAAIIGGVGPISTIVLAHIFLDERFTIYQSIGTLLVISGVIIISLKGQKS